MPTPVEAAASLDRPLGGYSYQRHQPEQSVLYKVIQENLETFLSLVYEECGRPLPGFVEKEFREYQHIRISLKKDGFQKVKIQNWGGHPDPALWRLDQPHFDHAV